MKILEIIKKVVKSKYPMVNDLIMDNRDSLYIVISVNKLLSKYPDMTPIRYFQKPDFKPTEHYYLGTILVGDNLWDNSEDIEILDYFGEEIQLFVEKIIRFSGFKIFYRSLYFLIVP